MARLDARLEVRIDSQLLGRLESRAALERHSVPHLVREALVRYLEESSPALRRRALEAAFELGVEVPADPQELKRQLLESLREETESELRQG